MKTDPVSFRPTASLDARLNALRARTGIPKSRLVELLADEAERARRYPGIAFRGPDQRRAAWMVGAPFDVWEIVQAWQDMHEDSSAVQERLRLSARQLQLALAYYGEFRDEIDAALVLERRGLSDLERAFPFVEVVRVSDK